MKKLIILLLALGLLLCGNTPDCNHIHDEDCGYNPTTETGCNHQHDEKCNGNNTIRPRLCSGPDCPLE